MEDEEALALLDAMDWNDADVAESVFAYAHAAEETEVEVGQDQGQRQAQEDEQPDTKTLLNDILSDLATFDKGNTQVSELLLYSTSQQGENKNEQSTDAETDAIGTCTATTLPTELLRKWSLEQNQNQEPAMEQDHVQMKEEVHSHAVSSIIKDNSTTTSVEIALDALMIKERENATRIVLELEAEQQLRVPS